MLQSWRGLGTLRAGRWYPLRRGGRCAGQGVDRGSQDVRWRRRWRRAAGGTGFEVPGLRIAGCVDMAACGSFVDRLGTGAGDPGRDGRRCGGLATRALSARAGLGKRRTEPQVSQWRRGDERMRASDGAAVSARVGTARPIDRRVRITGTSGFLSRRPHWAHIRSKPVIQYQYYRSPPTANAGCNAAGSGRPTVSFRQACKILDFFAAADGRARSA